MQPPTIRNDDKRRKYRIITKQNSFLDKPKRQYRSARADRQPALRPRECVKII